MDDLFDPVHNVEEDATQEGYEAGVRDGLVAGITEGRELGVQKGYEIGVELGFYSGCIRMWRQLAAQQALVVGERADRAIRSCEELLLSYPMCNPQDERLHELLEALRGKFKAAASQLGLLQRYFPREGSGAEGGSGNQQQLLPSSLAF